MTDLKPDPWEAAYLRFETQEEEIRKFMRRLRRAGAQDWRRDARVAELFCGRGNGLEALARMGFTNLIGVDLSPRLIAQYKGPATVELADCRQLPMEDRSLDIAIIQGGLHHLPSLPDDLATTLSEVRRVLREDGTLMVVEPWRTPFLSLVHWVSEIRLVRRLSNKMDAFATMTEHERTTYEQWLGQPDRILSIFKEHFTPEKCQIGWGKLLFVGRPRKRVP